MKVKRLEAWLRDEHVADLTSEKNGAISLSYTEHVLETYRNGVPLLSCSLPVQPRRRDARNFLAGLLPEGQALQAMADRAGLPTHDTFGLLHKFGRDVAGAVVISESQPAIRQGDVVEYSEGELAGAVADLPEHPLALGDDSELSIAGLQNKLLLVELGPGRWGRPVHGRPSTHILKVEDRRFAGMAEREAACLRLAGELGLTSVKAETIELAGIPCLIVSRFDRIVDQHGNVLARVHQEDACQALGKDPLGQERRGKYYSHGGPSLKEVARLLDRYASDGRQAMIELLRATTFTAAIGNADAHGKNLALLHPTAETIELAPLYDTVPTVLWPGIPRRTPAMPIGPRLVDIDQITGRDLVSEARLWPLSEADAAEAVAATANELQAGLSVSAAPADLTDLIGTAAARILSSF